ncbi:MAG: neutral zinc metallopeptidase, partial [Chitinophagaceae bacterium]
MRWQGRQGSSNVDDRRGISGGGIAVGGGILGIIALVVNFLLSDGDVSQLPLPGQNQPLTQTEQAVEDSQAQFVKVVLKDTEDVWNELFAQMGRNYDEPRLELFSGVTQSACGNASS